MRRLLTLLALAGASQLLGPPAAEGQVGRAVCEAYCATIAAGCYVFVGLAAGKEKCDAMYEACVAGCYAALLEAES